MSLLKATEDNIIQAAKTVKKGGLIVYPTDTVYGLGCDPFNVKAVKKVFHVKGGRKGKPLPILASDMKAVEKIAHMNKNAKKIAEEYWPGPLTLVVPRKPTLPSVVTCNLESVGVRTPDNKVALQLITLCGGLLVGTSANKTGQKPPKTAQEAYSQLDEQVDIILDGGEAQWRQESSILDLTSDTPRMIREGPIKLTQILKAIEDTSSIK